MPASYVDFTGNQWGLPDWPSRDSKLFQRRLLSFILAMALHEQVYSFKDAMNAMDIHLFLDVFQIFSNKIFVVSIQSYQMRPHVSPFFPTESCWFVWDCCGAAVDKPAFRTDV